MGMELLEMKLAGVSVYRHLVDIVYMPVIAALGLLGNLVTFYFFRFRSPASVFSFNMQYLSFVNILAILLKVQGVVLILVNTREGHFATQCSLSSFVDMVTYMASGQQLLLAVGERWRLVVHPDWEQVNIRTARIFSFVFFLMAAVLNVPILMLFGRRMFTYASSSEVGAVWIWQCFLRGRDNEVRLMAVYCSILLASLVAFTCGYAYFCWGVLREYRTGVDHLRTAHNSKVLFRSAQLYEILAVTFLVCYCLCFLGYILRAVHLDDVPFVSLLFKHVIDIMCYSNIVYFLAPPFLFFAASTRFRQECVNPLKCRPPRRADKSRDATEDEK